MSDFPDVRLEMVRAEQSIREALAEPSQGLRLDAVMRAYWETPAAERDTFVLALAGNLTLRPTSRPLSEGARA